jgi:hypothetical protein
MDLIVAIRFVLDIPHSPLCPNFRARTARDLPLHHPHRQCGRCAVMYLFPLASFLHKLLLIQS